MTMLVHVSMNLGQFMQNDSIMAQSWGIWWGFTAGNFGNHSLVPIVK